MLKGIPNCLSPELLKTISEMGHGDTLVVGDAYYPSAGNAARSGARLIRADGVRATALIDAILRFFPLDRSVEKPFTIMDLQDIDFGKVETPIWDEYISIVEKYDDRGKDAVGFVERMSFYELAGKAYAVLATGEESLYGCAILQKGVL